MAELDPDQVIARFRERAQAVRERGLPPVAGDERRQLIQAAETDFLDFALIAAAEWTVDGDHLVLRIPLHP
jgi:hypothetical protein